MFPFPTLHEKLTKVFHLIIPYTVICILLILDLVSLSFIDEYFTQLPLFLIALFYWALYRPTLLPLWLVFFLGLCIDSAQATPLGLHAFLFTGIYWSIVSQRLMLVAQSFGVIWLLFGMILVLFYSARWIIMSGVHWTLFPLQSSYYQILAVFFLFPILTLILHLSHKTLPPLKRQISMKF